MEQREHVKWEDERQLDNIQIKYESVINFLYEIEVFIILPILHYKVWRFPI